MLVLRAFSHKVKNKIEYGLENVVPQLKELVATSRSKVEVLKMRCMAIEKDFERSRHELKEAESRLEAVKKDLQTLYTLRANEYLKPRPEQKVKEINEQENRLNELEREAVVAVTMAREREEDLFSLFRSSNDLLYQKSIVYANRFILLGAVCGTGVILWRIYKSMVGVREGGVAYIEGGVANFGSEEVVLSQNSALKDLQSAQSTEFRQINEELHQVQERHERQVAITEEVKHHLDSLSAKVEQFQETGNGNFAIGTMNEAKLILLLLGVIGGVVGATITMVFVQR